MGTRGVFGFHKNGVDKITYNHYDYPTGLGKDVKEFIERHTINELEEIFDRIIMVDHESKPTSEQIIECKLYTNLSVSDQSTNDWYCITHGAQGKPEAYAEGLKYMLNDSEFLKASLFCEWGYVINLTTGRLEIYCGFQKHPCDNRYKLDTPPDRNGYYNCALIREIPLAQVKNFDMSVFEQEVSDDEEGE